MIQNFWIPEIIPLLQDKIEYKTLSPEIKNAYNETLSFLIFLDSVVPTNLYSISDYITAPEVNKIFSLQAFQEIIHNQSYAYILESICEPEEIHSIYYRFKEDEVLKERCKQITDFFSLFRDDPTDDNLVTALITDYMLEGLLFFNGFYFFYALAYAGNMIKTANEIKLINRRLFAVVKFSLIAGNS